MGPGHGTPDAEVLIAGDWDSVRTVVDVGGGTGSLLAEILRSHAGVRGTLVDLPATVARSSAVCRAASHERYFSQSPTERISFTRARGQSSDSTSGGLFEPLVPLVPTAFGAWEPWAIDARTSITWPM